MNRTPFERRPATGSRNSSFAPPTAPMPWKRAPLPGKSKKQRAKEARRRPVRAAYMAAHLYCQAARAGAPRPCWGPLECHEPLTKARGGAQDDPRNYRAVCSEHNRLISQDAEVMRWAYEHGFLRHSWEAA